MIALRALAFAGTIAAGLASAHASILYDNLGQPISTALPASADDGLSPLGASFATPNQATLLTSLTLWLGGDASNLAGQFQISVVKDAGTPGAPLPDLVNSPLLSLVFSDSVLTDPVTITANVPLQPNKTYWVMLDEYPDPRGVDDSPTTVQWIMAGDASGVGVAGQSQYWNHTVWLNDPTNGAFMMAVDPEAVVEPATLAVLGLGLTGLAALRRRPFAG